MMDSQLELGRVMMMLAFLPQRTNKKGKKNFADKRKKIDGRAVKLGNFHH